MYCKHYGFSEKPFDVTPQPKFLYLTPGHREALATLLYGICERRGFIAMVGDVGTGKTTLLRAAMQRLGKKVKSAMIFNSDMPFEEILMMILDELRLLKPGESLSNRAAAKRLCNYAIRLFAKGGNLVIMLDEAQNFSHQTLENFRLISNLETNNHKLIQIVIAGQVELDQKLHHYGLRPFVQRINLKRYVKPLSEADTYAYLDHRLRVANYNGLQLFDRRAQQLIWAFSRGVPRKINNLCDNALLNGYGTNKRIITGREIEEVIKDLSYSPYTEAGKKETKKRRRNPLNYLRKVAMF
jgi:general secretion pathway protein A